MRSLSRWGRAGLLLAVVVVLAALFAAVLTLKAGQPKGSIGGVTTPPTSGPPVPRQIPTLAPTVASCPETPFTIRNDPVGIGVTLTPDIKGFQAGYAIGLAQEGYDYHIIFGEVTEPASMAGIGWFGVGIGPLDDCMYNAGFNEGLITPIPTSKPGPVSGYYLTSASTGSITVTAISGEVISYKTASGASGRFNYVTGTFTP